MFVSDFCLCQKKVAVAIYFEGLMNAFIALHF